MTILVTGAGGFLGTHICRKLRAQNRSVRGFDLRYPGGALPEDVTGSILEPDQLAAAFQDVTGVVHCAALAQLWVPGRFDYDRVNVVGTCRVLAEARRQDAPLVHVSSYTTLIRDDVARDVTLDEDHEVAPNRLCGKYPRSKRQAELFVQAAAAAGQQACIVMPTAPIGVGDHNLTPPSAMIRDLALGRIPALLDCQLDLVDVEAVADATIAALERGESGQRYLLAGETVTLQNLAHLIAGISGTKAPTMKVPPSVALLAARVEAMISRFSKRSPKAPLTGVRLAVRPVRFSAERARERLGFAPRSVAELLPEAVRWLMEAEPV